MFKKHKWKVGLITIIKDQEALEEKRRVYKHFAQHPIHQKKDGSIVTCVVSARTTIGAILKALKWGATSDICELGPDVYFADKNNKPKKLIKYKVYSIELVQP